MQHSLKYCRETLNSIRWLKNRHEYLEKELIRLGGQKAYESTKTFYDNVITKLTEEMQSLPIGYRYVGTIYLKKPYTAPIQFEQIEGSAFLREDLISWLIEPFDSSKKQHYSSYFRTIYKKPDLQAEITRADTTPVYSQQEKAIS